MILSLAFRYQKHIALFLMSISFVQVTIAERIGRRYDPYKRVTHYSSFRFETDPGNAYVPLKQSTRENDLDRPVIKVDKSVANRPFTGGPTQPETQSFASVNSNNMVDLFTGDFSYNIPLLDVGGYPVNIAYHSGITMDEDASWVGLGWNINPGSITRNMRGVPDDFNGGTDTIKKVSSIKPNVSWGVNAGANMEIIGLPLSVGAGTGIFHTTYNGWGIEQSLNASINAGSKSHGYMSAGLSITNSSKDGISMTPSLGYKYMAHNAGDVGGGLSISAPYNSRTGLKSINLGLNANAMNKKAGNFGAEVATLSFTWPTSTPFMTMPMTNYNVSVTLKFGSEYTGISPDLYISGYYGAESIKNSDKEMSLPVFGYLNYQNMNGNWNSLTDFNREKEIPYREKPAVPHIAVPSYTYDVFSVSGEGTGGSFRPYRGDIGFVADHRSQSKTISGGLSIDIGGGNLVHGGTDLNANYSNTKTGPWESENTIGSTIGFRPNKGLYEGVYLRNPAEKTINTTAYYDAIGGDDVVAPALYQSSSSSSTIIATNTLNRYSGKTKVGSIDLTKSSAVKNTRDKRSQVISYLNASEASIVGLDKSIYHYAINNFEKVSCDETVEDENAANGTGLLGYYFNNTSLRGNYVQRNDTTVYFNWERGRPVDGISDNYFSVRWLGRLKAPETGTYTIAMKCDDGFRLWVNDTLYLNKWKRPVSWDSCKLNLVKGGFYNIKIEYYENAGYAYAEFLWKKPSDPTAKIEDNNKKRIPRQYLYPPLFKDTFNLEPALVKENRVNNFRKSSHISEIDVLNADGRKYVYGIPVYNLLQKEVSFAIEPGQGDTQTGLTSFSSKENSTDNESGKDGYYSRQEIPAYAHSYLLTGILSPDFVDVTGDGISDDDLGDAVKFDYSKAAGIAQPYEWRAPYSNKANFNEGLKSYNRDDKAHYIYGKKEVWYLHTIESKTMIATFTLEGRKDLLEIAEDGTKMNNNKAFRLKQIDLYSKADYLTPGRKPTPIKTVHFEYSYELCPGVNLPYSDSGKLTLKRIWFTYNGNEKGKLNPYVFNYHKNNPGYRTNASDKWGTYKDPSQNPDGTVSNADYPYALQDSAQAAYNAGAWMLDSIQLPSGGRIKVNYESDDYAYVQNRRATQMMELAGFGQSSNGSYSENLYEHTGFNTSDNLFIYVKIPKAVGSKQELYARYLEGMTKLYFRLLVQMPSNDGFGTGSEYVPCYAEPDVAAGNWYGTTGNPNIIWIKISGINKNADGGGSESALTQAAINFLRLNIPSKAYPGSEVDDNMGFKDGVNVLLSQVGNIIFMLNGFANTARQYNWARKTTLARSYVRLNAPTLKKYGGGLRVKSVLVYDHWNAMTKKKESVYGQSYDYTTIQNVNEKPERISSGVASWEPVIGGEENPFHLPIEYVDRIAALAPSSMQYSEEPLGEAFYPGASVGYSKVRTRSIHTAKTRSANGYSESTFYTSYDFPTSWDWSMLDNDTKKRFKPILRSFLRINAKSYLSISQGFKIELNDMNGKLRTEATYSETDSVHPISYTENFYRVDKQSVQYKHLSNVVSAIRPNGEVDTAATIGKDVELMADMRDQTSKSIGGNVNVNVDLFAVGIWPAAIPSVLNLYQKETNQYRTAAMTKVIYRYGILDSIVIIDKGSKVSTKNILYDAETGDALLARTQNEFNDPVYNFSYPSHWVYNGMGPAYQNIGAILEHIDLQKGKITTVLDNPDSVYLTAGDELLVYSKQTISSTGCVNAFATFPDAYKLWVIDSSAVNGGPQQLFLVDKNGVPFSGYDVTLKVVRSGRRNISGAVGTVVSLNNPLVKDGSGNYHLVFDSTTRVLSADASEMAQFWKVADKRRSDKEGDCVPTSADSARFAAEACSCLQPFFNYLISSGNLFLPRSGNRSRTIAQLVSAAGINISNCPILQDNLNEKFYSLSADPNDPIYRAMIGSVSVTLERLSASNTSFYNYTSSTCTPEGVIFRNPNVVIPQPDTVTVRIAPDFSANLLSTEACPTFDDSLTVRDVTSDHLLVENGLNLGGYERNAIAVMNFNRLNDIPTEAGILSARMILQADQRGHYPPTWTNANSVNPVDSMSISLATPGYFPQTSLTAIHEEILNSAWHREVKKIVPFQNDTLNVLDYVNGYRNNTYTSNSFMLTQGSEGLHNANVSSTTGTPGYLQSGYGNYYSTYYSQRYADSTKWPVIQVTYVIPAPPVDTAGAMLVYNSTIACTDITSRYCYSAVTDTVVNPYQYGILGNFRPLRGYVYYGRRNESDPLQSVNTRTNGTIKDFAPFWILQNNHWAPSYDTTRWVWNSQTTLFNRKGFDLENKDPIGRYNAGLYGYGLTMPTAVVQNSHYQEAAFEGFEDYDFVANTCDTMCTETRPFDFSAYKTAFTTTQAHTGLYSLQVPVDSSMGITAYLQPAADADPATLTPALVSDTCTSASLRGMVASKNTIVPGFAPLAGKKIIISGWVKEDNSCLCKGYTRNNILVGFLSGGDVSTIELNPSGNLVEGWQRYEAVVDIPANASQMTITLKASDSATTYFDDIRIHPYNAQMKSYVYNAVNLRMMATLDENNYATFYEYDDDGTLIRLKKETERGVQTIKETRSGLLKQ